ncbi:MazG nucleotide pyrophosphohydrolase domain-containing protein [Asaia sp. HumB]|uniref:MazG nucleotide pyrophosphohydrolase domain-containing protein n=1 Tax=Asaia sp. HumB TaxID=3035475 RepID=UPI0025575BB4|nr:MazG nucleotide pyrophosphohydrolase domain-containing protein [Asaia sp. HumB]MDL2169595.1 MazG nucleotide pyrophosphohydrolase domain-containing protein [Asaia sp. HumB]
MSDVYEPFSNGLSDAEAERLAILAEECGEVIQAVGKILRHGYEGRHPKAEANITNRNSLEMEMGDVLAAYTLMVRSGDLHASHVSVSQEHKSRALIRWTHHQEFTP